MVREKKDIKIGIILLISSVINYKIIIPRYVGGRAFTGLSPNFFPELATILLGIFSLALILTGWYSIHNKRKKEDDGRKKKEVEIVGYENYRVLITIAIISIYFILFEHFGFLWMTPIILAILMFCFGMHNPRRMLFFSIVTTVILFFLFEKGLKIPLH